MEKNVPELTPEQKKLVSAHQTNLISYSVVTALGIFIATVLIPNFVKLKKKADFGPEKFPYIVAGILIALGVIGLLMEYSAIRKEGVKIPRPKINFKAYVPQLIMLLLGFAFVALATVLGFIPAAILFLCAVLYLFGARKIKFNVVFAVIYVAILFLIFSVILGIRFTGGLISF